MKINVMKITNLLELNELETTWMLYLPHLRFSSHDIFRNFWKLYNVVFIRFFMYNKLIIIKFHLHTLIFR